MQRDDVMEMVRQAGMRLDKHNGGFVDASELKRFAKLVADKTRKELREEIIYTWVPPHFVDLAVKDEREACAKVCEEVVCTDYEMIKAIGDVSHYWTCAKAIRARGDQ